VVQGKGKKVETDQEKALREEMEALQVGGWVAMYHGQGQR
jgi:hypothetical protein